MASWSNQPFFHNTRSLFSGPTDKRTDQRRNSSGKKGRLSWHSTTPTPTQTRTPTPDTDSPDTSLRPIRAISLRGSSRRCPCRRRGMPALRYRPPIIGIRRTHAQAKSVGLVCMRVSGHPAFSLQSSNEPGELAQSLLTHDDNTVNIRKLEYLAVYGRDSMAVFRQLSTHGQKFDPESLYEPI